MSLVTSDAMGINQYVLISLMPGRNKLNSKVAYQGWEWMAWGMLHFPATSACGASAGENAFAHHEGRQMFIFPVQLSISAHFFETLVQKDP